MGREERREEERRRSGMGLWAVCVLGTQSGLWARAGSKLEPNTETEVMCM